MQNQEMTTSPNSVESSPIVAATCITLSPVQTRATDDGEGLEQVCSVCETQKPEITTSSVASSPPIDASTSITPSPVLSHQTRANDNGEVPDQSSSVCETQNSEMTTSSSSAASSPPIDASISITPSPVLSHQTRANAKGEVPDQSSSVCETQNSEMTTSSSSVASSPPVDASTSFTPSPVLSHRTRANDNGEGPDRFSSVCEMQNSEMTTPSSSVESLPLIFASISITPSSVLPYQTISNNNERDPEQLSSVYETQNTAMTTSSNSVESPIDANRYTAPFASALPPHQARSTENEVVPDQSCIVYSRQNSEMMSTSSTVEAISDFNIAIQIPETNLSSGGDVELGETLKQNSAGRQLFRWNLIFNVILWIIIPLPVWLPFVSKEISFYLLPSIQGAFSLFWIVVCLSAIRTTYVLYCHRNTDFKAKVEEFLKTKRIDSEARTVNETPIHHLAVISCYKEPVDLIAASVETLANQTIASNVTMVLSFEEKTPNLLNKQKLLSNLFGYRFHEMVFVTHPFGVEGEIPGKYSNANCGIRTGLAHIKQRRGTAFDPDRILVTTCDADSKFHPRYFEALEYRYEQEFMQKNGSDRMVGCVFQSPLLYNWNLDAASVVTRVTGIVRSFLMMGAMIPFNVNPMSIFSLSASLCIAGNFVHPGYQMDDIIALIR